MNNKVENSDLQKESNGFLDCIDKLTMQPAGRFGNLRVCRDKVYNYNEANYEDAYNYLCEKNNRHATYQEMLDWMNKYNVRPELKADEQLQAFIDSERRKTGMVETEDNYIRGNISVSKDNESVTVTADNGEETSFTHIHGWTHEDPALIYADTSISVYFYDS